MSELKDERVEQTRQELIETIENAPPHMILLIEAMMHGAFGE